MEVNRTAPLGDQLEGMKAIKQCTCNRRLLTSMKVQIGINLTDNNQITIIMKCFFNKT